MNFICVPWPYMTPTIFVPVTVKGKIKIELVLLRQFSKMELRGHWKSVTYAHLSLDGIWPFNARNLRYLSYTCPKITHDSQPLRTNISFPVSQYSLVTFVFIISWLFLFSGNLVLPKSVSAGLQFLRSQIRLLFIFCSLDTDDHLTLQIETKFYYLDN